MVRRRSVKRKAARDAEDMMSKLENLQDTIEDLKRYFDKDFYDELDEYHDEVIKPADPDEETMLPADNEELFVKMLERLEKLDFMAESLKTQNASYLKSQGLI